MLIPMSDRDINRFKVLQDVREHRLSQTDAANILNLSTRQIRRLLTKLAQQGAASLAHAARGKPSNRRYSDSYRAEVVLRIVKTKYAAREKLIEHHNLTVSKEALRQWMIAAGLWVPHSQRQPRIYQPRYRRDCLGELIQIDGSHHDWFEGRSPKLSHCVYR